MEQGTCVPSVSPSSEQPLVSSPPVLTLVSLSAFCSDVSAASSLARLSSSSILCAREDRSPLIAPTSTSTSAPTSMSTPRDTPVSAQASGEARGEPSKTNLLLPHFSPSPLLRTLRSSSAFFLASSASASRFLRSSSSRIASSGDITLTPRISDSTIGILGSFKCFWSDPGCAWMSRIMSAKP